MEYLDIKKLVMVLLLIAPIIIIAEVTAQDRNQTQATCNQTQVLRQDKDGEEICCHSAKCKPGETFHLCSENDGHDICSPCGDGYFTTLSVDTALVHKHFDPCMKSKCEDGAANINGSCICDILNGYYGNDSSRCIPKNCTAGFVLTLNGHCKSCENQDNCGKINSDRQSSGVNFSWIIGGVLAALAIAGTILMKWYRSRIRQKYTVPTAYSGNDKSGKKQNDLNNDYLDPETFESSVGSSKIKEIICQEPCIRRDLKENEKKQQAQPLDPRPFVVDCCGNQIQQESSFSSYSDSNTYDEIGEPHNADSTLSDEFQIEHVVGDNVLLQEQNVSSGQNCEVNDVVEVHVTYATAAKKDYKMTIVIQLDSSLPGSQNFRVVIDACSNESHSAESSCYCAVGGCTASDTRFHQPCEQEYILYETNGGTTCNNSHDDTIPKVAFQSDDVDNGEQPYFNGLNVHSSPHSRANNPTVNENLCEVEKGSTEEDRCVRRKEFVKTSERERKTSSSLSQEVKDQCVRQTESVETKKETSPIRTEEQDQCVRPKEFKPREETHILQRIVQEDKEFDTSTSESPRDIASKFGSFVKNECILKEKIKSLTDNECILKEKNKSLTDNECILKEKNKSLTDENEQQLRTIKKLQEQLEQCQKALEEKNQTLDIIVQQHLPELSDLFDREPLPEKSHQEDNQMRVYYDKQPTTAQSNSYI